MLLYKLVRAAVAARPGRDEIVLDRDNFPTDRYVAQGVAAELGLTLRWIDVDTSAGVTADQLAAAVGERTALVMLSHVAYRSAWLADAPTLTRDRPRRRRADAVGPQPLGAASVPTELDAWGVDLAVGCSYKYLNGGPGSPAFLYVADRHLADLTQPIQGWMGAADPFLMGPTYTPTEGIRRFLSGTPPVVGMLAIEDMLDLIEEAGIDAVRDEVGGPDAVRRRARRRPAGPAWRRAGLTARPGAPRRARHPQAPARCRRSPLRCGSAT